MRQVALDHMWTAMRFKRPEHIKVTCDPAAAPADIEGVDMKARTITPPADLQRLLDRNRKAREFFDKLSFTNRKEYMKWISEARKDETRTTRLQATVEKLAAGKKNPSEK